MAQKRICPSCGAEMPSDAPVELCESIGWPRERGPGEAVEARKSVDAQKTVRLALTPAEKPGEQVGRYKLLQQLGEGGCGVVYMARQEEPVKRTVALKVIKLGMDTREVIARFEAERQALAL